MGEASYNYVPDFLTNRMVHVQAEKLQLNEKKMGSSGTPQGSVISLLIFNLVMIGVAQAIAETDV